MTDLADVAHRWPTRRAKARSRSSPSCPDDASAAPGRARTTVPLPAGSASSRWASWARSRRLTWWRTTLPPTALLTTSPTCGAPTVSDGRWCRTTRPPRARMPSRTTDEKSVERRIRLATGSTRRLAPRRAAVSSGRQFGAALAATGSDDRPAGPGAHAQPKAVRLGAAAVVRLEGALTHGRTPSVEAVTHRDPRPRGCGLQQGNYGLINRGRAAFTQTRPRYGLPGTQVKPGRTAVGDDRASECLNDGDTPLPIVDADTRC
jgi:hypothetical protein